MGTIEIYSSLVFMPAETCASIETYERLKTLHETVESGVCHQETLSRYLQR